MLLADIVYAFPLFFFSFSFFSHIVRINFSHFSSFHFMFQRINVIVNQIKYEISRLSNMILKWNRHETLLVSND